MGSRYPGWRSADPGLIYVALSGQKTGSLLWLHWAPFSSPRLSPPRQVIKQGRLGCFHGSKPFDQLRHDSQLRANWPDQFHYFALGSPEVLRQDIRRLKYIIELIQEFRAVRVGGKRLAPEDKSRMLIDNE